MRSEDPHFENIIQHNAAELAHIINQYELPTRYRLKISDFLKKDTERDRARYNKKLRSLKKYLSDVTHSDYFLKYLLSITNEHEEHSVWKRSDPIENTPKTHMIHASYFRIRPNTCFPTRDKHLGKPRPSIFLSDHNVLTGQKFDTIINYNKLYTYVMPFGTDFPDILEIEGMLFELYDIWNPLYVSDQNGTGPAPIIINGAETEPISNRLYTRLYKEYINRQKMLGKSPI